jgi:UPF0755 protein
MKLRYIFYCLFLLAISLSIYSIWPNSYSDKKTILITKGTSKKVIAEMLAKEQLISYPTLYWLLSQFLTINGYIQAGEYEIPPGSSPLSIINMMKNGEIVIRKITVPEGFTTFQVLSLVQNDSNLIGTIQKKYQEGAFLPNTYFYTLGDTKQAMLDRMHQSLIAVLNQLWVTRAQTIPLKTPQEILTLASIVEKETKFDDERPIIASVFYNRLKLGMRLQADPTTIYAITEGKYILDRLLTRKDLQINSPFNTYVVAGLPPSPIANPGISSIQAVVHPADTTYLYFVANSEGRHSFSTKLNDHNRYVQDYRKLGK